MKTDRPAAGDEGVRGGGRARARDRASNRGAADRTTFDRNDGSLLNPVNLGVALLNLFDRPNKLDEPPGRSTVNLALKARKPA